MTTHNAQDSGTFLIGGDLPVNRLGFGAMRITGPGIWDQPTDLAEAKRTLARLPELGVNFIDTADSYGPFVSEDLLREVLHPYENLVIATKGGFARSGPDVWRAIGRPEYLHQCLLMSLRRLKVDQIDLWQLHRIDPKVPRDEQFGALKQFQDDGLVRHLGLSQVSVEEIEAASAYFQVATVQNHYNLGKRDDEDVLTYCEARNIGFIPWYPLAAGDLLAAGGVVNTVAKRHGATPSQVALAWLLQRSPVMLPIPGTGKVAHLEQNVAAASLKLSEDDVTELNRVAG